MWGLIARCYQNRTRCSRSRRLGVLVRHLLTLLRPTPHAPRQLPPPRHGISLITRATCGTATGTAASPSARRPLGEVHIRSRTQCDVVPWSAQAVVLFTISHDCWGAQPVALHLAERLHDLVLLGESPSQELALRSQLAKQSDRRA